MYGSTSSDAVQLFIIDISSVFISLLEVNLLRTSGWLMLHTSERIISESMKEKSLCESAVSFSIKFTSVSG